MLPRTRRGLLLSIVLVASFACAQPVGVVAGGLSLDAILMRLQIRRWEYSRSVPDFFADEYVTSEMRGLRMAPIRAVTESLFRLRRATGPDIYPPDLEETRTVRRSNGVRFVTGSPLVGPVVLINAFSNGLSTITFNQKACYDFTVSPHGDVRHQHVFAIDYRLKPDAESTGYCLPWRNVTGQAVVERDSFNVVHFDMHVPRYPVAPGMVGPWRWSIEYMPVNFDGNRFLMPRHIDSNSESQDGRFVWSFNATYSNYHKTGVHSRIITDPDDLDAPR